MRARNQLSTIPESPGSLLLCSVCGENITILEHRPYCLNPRCQVGIYQSRQGNEPPEEEKDGQEESQRRQAGVIYVQPSMGQLTMRSGISARSGDLLGAQTGRGEVQDGQVDQIVDPVRSSLAIDRNTYSGFFLANSANRNGALLRQIRADQTKSG